LKKLKIDLKKIRVLSNTEHTELKPPKRLFCVLPIEAMPKKTPEVQDNEPVSDAVETKTAPEDSTPAPIRGVKTSPDNSTTAPKRYVKCGTRTYSEEVLAKKRELALKALAKAQDARKKKIEEEVEAKLKQKALEKPKTEPKPKPRAEPEPEEEEVEEIEDVIVPYKKAEKPVKKAHKKPPVYEDSTDDSESDDDAYVLTKKKTIKKLKQLKNDKKNRHDHELSEQAILKKWAEERQLLAMRSLFPNHGF
jgi:hypothetical protein